MKGKPKKEAGVEKQEYHPCSKEKGFCLTLCRYTQPAGRGDPKGLSFLAVLTKSMLEQKQVRIEECVIGVVYREKAGVGGIMLNHCPFCGEDLSQFREHPQRRQPVKSEIGRDFYCSADVFMEGDQYGHCGMTDKPCPNYIGTGYCSRYHRKHPTLEQYKEEYGEEWPDDAAVYCRRTINNAKTIFADWTVMSLSDWQVVISISPKDVVYQTVCACTPFGKPPEKWRP